MKAILLIIFVFAATFAVAQDGLPANPNPGKCYVKCVTHDEFTTETEIVEIQAAYKILTVVPATFKWVEEKVLVKEASKKLIYHPAVYETQEVAYVKKEEEKVLAVVPATFNSESKTIEIFPKTGAWKYTAYADCASPNPKDCQTLCYIEKPAQYTDVPTKPLAADANTTESLKPKKDATYKKQVIVTPARMEEIEIPAVYATIKMQVIDVPASTVEKLIPAKTKTVSKEVLTKKGGINTWEEIDCGLVKPNTLNILWDLNSANLRGATKKEIDNVLLSLLNEKPNISIELTSHTDSRGSDEFNRALSQRRADAVKNYLVSRGVSQSRITSKGYGETRLLNNCSNGVRCSESQHQTNRRTEYRVIGQQ